MPETKRDWRPKEFAEETGISLATVFRWIGNGTLKSYRLGGLRFIDRAAFEAMREAAQERDDAA